MAATRFIAMHIGKGRSVLKSLREKTDYAENPDKTNGKEFITSYACGIETAAEEFLLAHSEYEKRARRKYDHEVIAYQIRQSFKPGEVTPEEANRIGYETAMRFTKGDHAFIVATHTDRAHVHNHVIFSAVNLKYTRKFKDFLRSGLALQRVSDIVCLEHGLSVIKPRPYSQREKRSIFPKRNAFRDVIREAIDIALSKKPKDYETFLSELERQGYEIKRGKHTAVKGKNQKRFIRFRSLGEGYSEEDIRRKIEGVAIGKKNQEPEYTGDDFDMLLNLQDIIAKGKGKGYEIWAKKYNVKNVMKALLFFQEKGLRTYAELAERAAESSKRFSKLSDEIKNIEKRMKEISELRTAIINYSKTRQTYIDYRKSGYSRKFFSEHKEDIQIHKSAKETFQKLGTDKIPKVKELNNEFQELLTQKRKAYEEYKEARRDMQLYQIAKYDIDKMLENDEQSKQQARENQKRYEKSL
ncbi:MAG: relaxase/mobilization nuclease domain-containing protein [Lachnospiraceae bacterium]|nr:relaxase/mobilization nuclease domain-containing protein [Lachnospiraceae bacterium]